jgi:hypothetical protein
MAEIVSGLFGVNPQQLMQQRQTMDANNAFRFAQLSPMERAQMSIYQGGAGLGRAATGLLGGDPELEKVSKIKQLSSQFDLTTAQGARDFARALQPFAPQEAIMAVREADRMEQAGLGRQKTTAEIQRAEGLAAKEELSLAQEEKLRAELATLGPNPTEQQILTIVTKYGSPDRILRELTASRDRQAAMADRRARAAGEGDGIGKPGPVGKSGAYRDISGTIFGPTEMKPIRQEFEGAQKLLDTLNQVKASDVKDAQSIIDWTTKGETKALASKKTLMAQTKIAASQLMEQIGQLPPGSASDADMRASMKSFPGYSDADALAAWVNETKRKLEFNINRGTDQFGFAARVKPTEPINLKPAKPSAGSVASDDNALINKYLTPKK